MQFSGDVISLTAYSSLTAESRRACTRTRGDAAVNGPNQPPVADGRGTRGMRDLQGSRLPEWIKREDKSLEGRTQG